jgi:hypothetical protein
MKTMTKKEGYMHMKKFEECALCGEKSEWKNDMLQNGYVYLDNFVCFGCIKSLMKSYVDEL